MGDMVEAFKALKEYHKQKRTDKREKSPDILSKNGIKFTSHNSGAHLIVTGKSGFGIVNLVNFVKGKNNV